MCKAYINARHLNLYSIITDILNKYNMDTILIMNTKSIIDTIYELKQIPLPDEIRYIAPDTLCLVWNTSLDDTYEVHFIIYSDFSASIQYYIGSRYMVNENIKCGARTDDIVSFFNKKKIYFKLEENTNELPDYLKFTIQNEYRVFDLTDPVTNAYHDGYQFGHRVGHQRGSRYGYLKCSEEVSDKINKYMKNNK